jgi:FlaA1/EpsC-like NDP-sugar epimerase
LTVLGADGWEDILLHSKKRFFVVLLVQVVFILSALALAYAVRFDFSVTRIYKSQFIELAPAILLLKLVVFAGFDLFRGWWRYVSMADLMQIVKANLVASLAFVLYAVLIYRMVNIPRSVLILDGVFCFLMMGGVRFATRAFRENYFPMFSDEEQPSKRVLIVGAGDAGQMIAREVRSNPRLEVQVVGFVDDDPLKRAGMFQGVRVLGRQVDLEVIVLRYDVEEIIIAIPSATGPQVRSIVDRCRLSKVKFKILPGVGDLINGLVSVQQLREVDLEDLLGRAPISLDEAQISSYLQGKRVLVTGAGGSIGSEICRQIVRYGPEKLILFENAETPLFQIERELVDKYPDIYLVPIIGDVRNRSRVNGIFDEQMPQVVFHAAAYKHVPMMEANPAEAVNNNVQGSRLIADAAHAIGVETFVMISTDKAVRPTNVMGASKRVAELYVQSLARISKTRFVTTRFGNVLGSSGSVIPTFREQINNGGPVTVTHPEVTRFFMTIPEASQLVLQAGSMGQGGEIYLFNMGEPVKIATLAEELIRLSGLQLGENIEITYTGLRPGEKLYEELLLADEGALPTHHEKICIAGSAPPNRDLLLAQLEPLLVAAEELDLSAVKSCLRRIVPEYTPVEHAEAARAKVIPLQTAAKARVGGKAVTGVD